MIKNIELEKFLSRRNVQKLMIGERVENIEETPAVVIIWSPFHKATVITGDDTLPLLLSFINNYVTRINKNEIMTAISDLKTIIEQRNTKTILLPEKIKWIERNNTIPERWL